MLFFSRAVYLPPQVPAHLIVAVGLRMSHGGSHEAVGSSSSSSREAEGSGDHARLLTDVVEVPKYEIELSGLTVAQEEALLCHALGTRTLPEGLVTLIRTRSSGNPFVSRELARALLHTKQLVVTDGKCELAAAAAANGSAARGEGSSDGAPLISLLQIELELPESIQVCEARPWWWRGLGSGKSAVAG